MSSVTKLPTRADRINAAADRAFEALHRTRTAAWNAALECRIDDPAEDAAGRDVTAAVTELQMLALGLDEETAR